MSLRIMGWYGRANCGDDAFVDAFHELLPGRDLAFYEPTSGPLELAPSEELVLGGGDVIKPYYLSRIAEDQPFWMVGCGLGYESEISELAKLNIKGAILRNPSDVQIATEAGIPAIYAPDICFALPRQARTGTVGRAHRKKLGVILSGHPTSGIEQPTIREASYFEYFQWELASTLDALVDYFDIHWISFSADPDAWDETPNYGVRRKMEIRKNQTFWSYTAGRPMDQVAILAEMDLVLTMKFHGAVFSAVQGIPFVTIGQTRKLEEFCRQSDLNDVMVAPYEFTKSRALQAIKAAELPGVSAKLLALTERNHSLVREAVTKVGLPAR